MSAAFRWLSQELKRKPLRTNIVLSTFIGFCGDVVCQTIYEPIIGVHRLTPTSLPPQSFSSPLICRVQSPSLVWRKRQEERDGGSSGVTDTTVYLDFRRSIIFCSFSCLFSVPYFLWVYKGLDRLYPPVHVTKVQAIYKGFLSYIAANLTTPLYMAHITSLDRFVIYRDGRDGRRRIPHSSKEDEGRPSEYQMVKDTAFNCEEYLSCVTHDWKKRVRYDFPDVLRYGLVFWGANWLPMFYYLPPHFRLLYSASLQVVWSGIMSYMLHRGEK